jgi:hypothetical protein
MIKKRFLSILAVFSLVLCMSSVTVFATNNETVTTAAPGSLADPENFPNQEVAIAESMWKEFAYGSPYSGSWEMNYLGRNVMPDETPEIDWYFPYFIDFCKKYDLTTYKPVGDFELYELIMDDFEEYYAEKSEWQQIQCDGPFYIYPKNVTNILEEQYYFSKNEGIWVYGIAKTVSYGRVLEFTEVLGEVPPVDDNFELYKTPEITQPPTSTEVSSSKATSPERYITPDGNVKYVTEVKEDKDTPV